MVLKSVKELLTLSGFHQNNFIFFPQNIQASSSGMGLKPLCPTRWTARTVAIDAVLKDYSVLMDTLEEISLTTHDEYGMKASGYLQSLQKFNTLFGLKLVHILFCAAEQVSLVLQKKSISISDALAAVNAAIGYYNRLMSEEEFNCFFDSRAQIAESHNIGKPELPQDIGDVHHSSKMEAILIS